MWRKKEKSREKRENVERLHAWRKKERGSHINYQNAPPSLFLFIIPRWSIIGTDSLIRIPNSKSKLNNTISNLLFIPKYDKVLASRKPRLYFKSPQGGSPHRLTPEKCTTTARCIQQAAQMGRWSCPNTTSPSRHGVQSKHKPWPISLPRMRTQLMKLPWPRCMEPVCR